MIVRDGFIRHGKHERNKPSYYFHRLNVSLRSRVKSNRDRTRQAYTFVALHCAFRVERRVSPDFQWYFSVCIVKSFCSRKLRPHPRVPANYRLVNYASRSRGRFITSAGRENKSASGKYSPRKIEIESFALCPRAAVKRFAKRAGGSVRLKSYQVCPRKSFEGFMRAP